MATLKLKDTFKSKTEDGVEVELSVKRPDIKVLDEAQAVFNRTFSQAIKNKAPLRAAVDKIVREQNIWDDERQAELDSLDAEIETSELKVRQRAASGLKKLELRKVAVELRKLRMKRLLMLAQKNNLDNVTCESQAENRRFDFLVSACTKYEDTGELVFKSLEDYLNRANEQVAIDAASHLAMLVHNFDPDYQKKLPENKFLLDYKYCNDDLHLIDKDGNLCDEDFKLVDSDGFYLKDGKRVDKDGNEINDDGTLKIETREFDD
jgi:hypothetical protein